jgi:hypothetical protein
VCAFCPASCFKTVLMIFSYIDNPSYGNPDGMCEDIMKNDFELKRKRVQLSVLSTQVCFLIDF